MTDDASTERISVDPEELLLDILERRVSDAKEVLNRSLKNNSMPYHLVGLDRALRRQFTGPDFTIVSPENITTALSQAENETLVLTVDGNKYNLVSFGSDGSPHESRTEPNRAIRALQELDSPPQVFVVGKKDAPTITFDFDDVEADATQSSTTEEASGNSAEERRGELVQLRFADENNEIANLSAAEMADVLQGLVELTSQIYNTGELGNGLPPEVRVRPAKSGSFIIEAVMVYQSMMDWTAANPEGATGLSATAGAALVKTIQVGTKLLKGNQSADVEDMADGQVKVKWQDGTVNTMSKQTWEKVNLMKRPTRKAFRKLMAPLGDEADSLEIRAGTSDQSTEEILHDPPETSADRSDYRAAAAEKDEIIEESEKFEAEAQLQNVDFWSGEKWRIKTKRGTRLATIEDEEFLKELDKGLSLHKNDIFNVVIQEDRTTTNGQTSKDWTVIEIIRVRNGGESSDVD